MTQQLLEAHYLMMRDISIELGIGMAVTALSYLVLRRMFR